MERSQPCRDEGCQQGNPKTHFLCSYQFGERIAWSVLPVRHQFHFSAARVPALPHALAITAVFVRFISWGAFNGNRKRAGSRVARVGKGKIRLRLHLLRGTVDQVCRIV